MPIYAYRCERCGHTQDVIQKFSDAPLKTCTACGAEAFAKQLTAPSFQLKGSGWYVTDFRDNGKSQGAKAGEANAAESGAKPVAEGASATITAPESKPAQSTAASGTSGTSGTTSGTASSGAASTTTSTAD
jgi:putative FmdB family regulatory protein